MTTQSSNILLVLANAVANFNGKITESKKQADLLLRELNAICPDDLKKQLSGVLAEYGFSLYEVVGFIGNLKTLSTSGYLTRHTAKSKEAQYKVVLFLQEAAEKHAANEQAAHDAEMAAIAQHPVIAPVVAACAKSRELIIELNTCDKVRFFEIYSEITTAGKLPKLTPYFSMDFQTQEIFNTKKSTDALVTYNNFVKSGFVDAYILTHLFTAVRNAAQRLDLIVETSLYIAGQHQYNESEKTAGYKLLRLFGEYTIGWVLDEPTNEPALIDDTNGLFVQTANGEWAHVQDAADEADISVEQYLFDRNTLSHAQFIQQQADEKGIALGDYLDLYPEAGEFDSLDFSEVVQTYKKAETIDENSDSEAQSATELLIVNFIKFLLPRATERIEKTIAQTEKIGVRIYDYVIDRICDNLDSGVKNYPISLYVINGKDCYLKCKHFALADGYENSPTVSIDGLNHFQTFYSKEMRQFFQTIFAIPS